MGIFPFTLLQQRPFEFSPLQNSNGSPLVLSPGTVLEKGRTRCIHLVTQYSFQIPVPRSLLIPKSSFSFPPMPLEFVSLSFRLEPRRICKCGRKESVDVGSGRERAFLLGKATVSQWDPRVPFMNWTLQHSLSSSFPSSVRIVVVL
jgi:hypothetical protein